MGSWSVAGMQGRHLSVKPLYVVCIMHVSDFCYARSTISEDEKEAEEDWD